jgi:hypothetical protein
VRSLFNRPINYLESRNKEAERPYYPHRTAKAITGQVISADIRTISQNEYIKRPGLGISGKRSLFRGHRGFSEPRLNVESSEAALYRPPILGTRLGRLGDEETATSCLNSQRQSLR